MLPPPPPPPHGPLQSRQDESHPQSNDNDDPLNTSWLNNWRSSPTTNSAFVPGPSSNLWADRITDPLFLYRQQIAASYQIQPPVHHDSTINASAVYPSHSAGPLGTMGEPTLQPLHSIPVTMDAQHLDSGMQPSQLQRKQHNSQPSQFSETDWETHRSKIKELYMDQNASLEKTMSIMSKEFGFSPSLVP
jgi:hypothetical protein